MTPGDPELGEAAGRSVSARRADAARERLRLDALGHAVTAWEQQYGTLTEAEVVRAEGSLEDATGKRRSGA